jgi:hypothetical protein
MRITNRVLLHLRILDSCSNERSEVFETCSV